MLMNYLKREDLLRIDYESVRNVDASEFDVAELRNLRAIPMLYQSGYLTIKDFDCDFYTLGVPDEEVRRDLAKLVAGAAADTDMTWASSISAKLVGADFPAFFVGLKSLYAHMPYGSLEGTVHEHSYVRILCTLLAAQGVTTRAEDVQSNGRADLIAEHRKGIFIFELKVDESVDKAFKQIREKGYAQPYAADSRPVWLVGLSFDSKTRHLADFAAVALTTNFKGDKP
jgi:hypothetical protein